MSLDSSIISYAVKRPKGFIELQRAGITEDHFTDDYAKVWKWLKKQKREHGTVPSSKVVSTRYPHVDIHSIKDRDLPILVGELQKRRKFMDFLEAVEDASRINGPEDIDVVMAQLMSELNKISVRGGHSSLVDLFAEETKERILADQKRRRSGQALGIPTSLKRLDSVTGGLQAGRLNVVMARPGVGKSWLDLLFVASGVLHGAKVGLYPLEMTLEDTALRLYTIFSCKMFGADKSLKNLDLTNGRVSKKKIVRLLNLLEDRFKGQLFVADIGSMADPYTVERVEAEQEIYKFDMQWIDYITLMKAPGVGRDGGEDHTTIKALSNGLKQIAVRQNCVEGVSAQVNREAVKGNNPLPRLDQIAYGDAIGQDADLVVPIARRGADLIYGATKNRHGPEIGRTRVKFAVNEGAIEEHERQDDDDESE